MQYIDNTCQRLEALNNWLKDVYNKDISLDQLLLEEGFDPAEIKRLKQAHLNKFLHYAGELLDSYPDLTNDMLNRIMIIHYGLIDGKPQVPYNFAGDFGVCGARIRQLIHKRMSKYHDPARQVELRKDFARIARRLLIGESGQNNCYTSF